MRHVGEAHLNPAVSLALLLTRRASVIKCLLFIAAQFLGAIIGAGLAVGVTSAVIRDGRRPCYITSLTTNESHSVNTNTVQYNVGLMTLDRTQAIQEYETSDIVRQSIIAVRPISNYSKLLYAALL